MRATPHKFVAPAVLLLLPLAFAACGGSPGARAPGRSTASTHSTPMSTAHPAITLAPQPTTAPRTASTGTSTAASTGTTTGTTTGTSTGNTPTTGTTPGVSTSAPPTTGPAPLEAVDWTSATVPGAVCGAATPITLSKGSATLATPPGMHAGSGQVVASLDGVHYGDLYGRGHDVAVLDVWCSDGGTAAAELADSLVVVADELGTLHVLDTLSPQQPASERAGPHVPYFDGSTGGVVIAPGSITVKELWYSARDATCCPSVHATTVWDVRGTTFSPRTTVGGAG
ncbi:MAG: hypothetical protein ACRDWE_01520 [Acidimicrobiales bacterium]